jgi:hypothetical protein
MVKEVATEPLVETMPTEWEPALRVFRKEFFRETIILPELTS